MGEKIRSIGKIKLKQQEYEVELNEPLDELIGGMIHIQNDNFRMELSQKDFYEMASAIMLAQEQLLRIKNGK